jgi:predicted amidohydrolase YtcJ
VRSPRLLLTNARLVGDDGDPCAVLVDGGLVRAIGEPPGEAARNAEVVDLDGRFLMRGLWDNHVHVEQWALARRRLDVSGCRSAAQCCERVRRRLAEDLPPPGRPLLGHGFRDGLWPDAPSVRALDEAAGAVPVVLVSHDLHCGWLNSAAFLLFGLPPDDNGLLREGAFHALMPRLSHVSTRVLDDLVRDAAQAAAARGVTGVVDFEMGPSLDGWTRRFLAGARTLRVECAFYAERFAEMVSRGLRAGDEVPGSEGLLTVGPLKVLLDGSLNTRTAYCHEPYPEPEEGPHPHGLLMASPEDLAALMREAHRHGLRCAIHAIGDRANTLALDGFARSGARGSVEHAQLLCPDDLPRFAQLGVTASIQPAHLIGDRDVADRHWRGRTAGAFPFRDLLRHGAVLRFGSDAPVAPLDPWVSIGAAVRRSGDDRPSWHPEQEMPVADALAASTQGRYTPRPGDHGDLVMTELDPLTAGPEALRDMPVFGTLLAGRWTWRANEGRAVPGTGNSGKR